MTGGHFESADRWHTLSERVSASCVARVLADSRPGGATDSYYHRESWEAGLQTTFQEIANERTSVGKFVDMAKVYEATGRLNHYYRTLYSARHFPVVVACVEGAVHSHGWWSGPRPSLLSSSDFEAEEIASVVRQALEAVGATPAPQRDRPKLAYSLITKFLHFCFPETFPIFDSQVAASIQMWSYIAYTDRGPQWKRFRYSDTTPTNGSGYGGIIDFYRQFWLAANDAARTELQAAAYRISAETRGRVIIADLIDKVLWYASGDPRLLGLLKSPEPTDPNIMV